MLPDLPIERCIQISKKNYLPTISVGCTRCAENKISSQISFPLKNYRDKRKTFIVCPWSLVVFLIAIPLPYHEHKVILFELVIYPMDNVFCFLSFNDNEKARLIRERSSQHSQSAELAICICVTVPCCRSKISRTPDNLFALDLAFKDIYDVASRGRGPFTCFTKHHIIKSDHCPLDCNGDKTLNFSI